MNSVIKDVMVRNNVLPEDIVNDLASKISEYATSHNKGAWTAEDTLNWFKKKVYEPSATKKSVSLAGINSWQWKVIYEVINATDEDVKQNKAILKKFSEDIGTLDDPTREEVLNLYESIYADREELGANFVEVVKTRKPRATSPKKETPSTSNQEVENLIKEIMG